MSDAMGVLGDDLDRSEPGMGGGQVHRGGGADEPHRIGHQITGGPQAPVARPVAATEVICGATVRLFSNSM